jgi:LPXTG-motif cell wall-anchored protein
MLAATTFALLLTSPASAQVVSGLTTQASTNSATVAPGTVVTDTATLTSPPGSPTATGTVTYTLMGPNPDPTCTAPVAGTSTTAVGSPSGPFTVTAPGTYNFVATYSGDLNHVPIATPVGCGTPAEMFTVVAAPPAIFVDKTATPRTRPAPGGDFTFNVTVTNTGTTAVTITSLTDDVYLNIVGRGTCGTAIGAKLAPAAAYSCSFTGSFTGVAGAAQTDVVTARAADDAGNVATDTDDAVVGLTPVKGSSPTTTPTTTPTTPAASGSAAAPDPTRDNGPGLDPRGDLISVGAEHGNAVTLSARLASPADPRSDPNWQNPDLVTGMAWIVDTNGDGPADFVAAVISRSAALHSQVRSEKTGAFCPATATFAAGLLKSTFDRKCIGSPATFRVQAGMIYNTGTTASRDLAPDNAYCCLVAQAAASAPTSPGGGSTSTDAAPGGELARTGSNTTAPSVFGITLVLLGALMARGGRRRRELEEFRILVFGP